MQIHVSDTSRDGSSLEFIAATSGRECYIQDAIGRGLCVAGQVSVERSTVGLVQTPAHSGIVGKSDSQKTFQIF